jgi:hypothetical protein
VTRPDGQERKRVTLEHKRVPGGSASRIPVAHTMRGSWSSRSDPQLLPDTTSVPLRKRVDPSASGSQECAADWEGSRELRIATLVSRVARAAVHREMSHVNDQTQAEVPLSPATESVDAPRTRREIVRIRRSSTTTTVVLTAPRALRLGLRLTAGALRALVRRRRVQLVLKRSDASDEALTIATNVVREQGRPDPADGS